MINAGNLKHKELNEKMKVEKSKSSKIIFATVFFIVFIYFLGKAIGKVYYYWNH